MDLINVFYPGTPRSADEYKAHRQSYFDEKKSDLDALQELKQKPEVWNEEDNHPALEDLLYLLFRSAKFRLTIEVLEIDETLVSWVEKEAHFLATADFEVEYAKYDKIRQDALKPLKTPISDILPRSPGYGTPGDWRIE